MTTPLPLLPTTIRAIVARVPAVEPHLSRRARLLAGKAAEGIADIRAAYHDRIVSALITYFESGGSIVQPRSMFKQAMVEAFGEAFDQGWVEGGGQMPPDKDAVEYLNERVSQEVGFIDTVFAEARDLRKDPEADWFVWLTRKADGYTASVASVYNAAKMLANERQMLTWHLGRTEQHCVTCAKLNGQRHRASWYISRNYIPRRPGANMDCQGYNCDCRLQNDKGEEVTI